MRVSDVKPCFYGREVWQMSPWNFEYSLVNLLVGPVTDKLRPVMWPRREHWPRWQISSLGYAVPFAAITQWASGSWSASIVVRFRFGLAATLYASHLHIYTNTFFTASVFSSCLQSEIFRPRSHSNETRLLASLSPSFSPCVCMYQHDSHATDFHEIWYWGLIWKEKLSWKWKFGQNRA
jgi:hypothetical protein